MPSDELEHQGADVDAAAAGELMGVPGSRWEWETNVDPPCGCPVFQGRVYHDRETCTDPVAKRLEWYGTPPPDATGGPRPTTPGATL